MRVRAFEGPPSSPNVVESRVTSPSQARLANTIVATPRGVICAFSLYVVAREAQSTGPIVGTLAISGASPASYDVELRLDGASKGLVIGTGRLNDGGAVPASFQPVADLPDARWQRVRIELAIGPGGHLNLDVGGTPVLAATGAPFTDIGAGSTATLTVGLKPLASAGTWQVLYDDVVCDHLP